MINTKNISLSELLRDFNAGLNKTAGEDCPPGAPCPPGAAPAPAPAGAPAPVAGEELCPECMSNPCICEDEDGDASPEDMIQAAVAAKTKQDEAVDATKALRDMADEYIDNHDQAIAKEAAVFGELFAKSACEAMNRYSYPMDMPTADEYSMFKQACDNAYTFALGKIAEEAAAANDDDDDDEEDENLSAAVRDAAAAARALAEKKKKESKEKDEEEATPEEMGDAAQGAYDETMAQMQGAPAQGAPAPAPADPQAAAQGAYNEAMAQMQPAAAPAAPQMAAASQNAYDQAMAQMQAQQPQPQAAPYPQQ